MSRKIIRVFPKRTSYTPDDPWVFIGAPPKEVLLPDHDEVHVSCIFTWDKDNCRALVNQWKDKTERPVKLGGCAFNSEVGLFVPGCYVKTGIVFTSRGCNNNCPWCIVPKQEGALRMLPIQSGNIIQDNNFLQTDKRHKEKVFEMLRHQKKICFKGGLEAELVDDHFINGITSLRINELWLACDTDDELPALKQACSKLRKAGFNRNKIRCYALSYGKNMDRDEARLQEIYHAGAMPFCQLYRDFSEVKTTYPANWRQWQRMWSRPAAIRAHMEKGTRFEDFLYKSKLRSKSEA